MVVYVIDILEIFEIFLEDDNENVSLKKRVNFFPTVPAASLTIRLSLPVEHD